MAKQEDKDITNISAVISQMGINSERLQAQFQKSISSGERLNKTMTDLAKKGYTNLTEALRKNQEQQKFYLKHVNELNELDIKRFNLLKDQEKAMLNGSEALRRTTTELGHATIGVELFTMAAAAAEATLSLGLTVAIQAARVALQGFSFGIGAIISLYQTWNEMMETTVRSMSELALATGATGEQLDQLQGLVADLSDDFSNLGGSVLGIEEATDFISELTPALRDTRLLTDELATSMLEVTRIFGLSADQASNLYRLLESGSLGSTESLADFSIEMDIFAHSIGATSGQIMQDFSDSSDFVARFGRDGVDAFRNAATQAQAFGFEARQIFEMASQFNTFRQASDSVNQLNAMLGTSISSFELMSEQDPSARIEMLRQAIIGSGTAWSDMDQYQRQAIANSLNLSEQEAARLFDEGISLQQLQQEQQAAQAAEEARAERRETSEQQMADLLERTSSLWDSIDRVMQRIGYHLATLLGPLFGEVRGASLDIFGSIDQWLTKLENSGQAQDFIQAMVNAFQHTENFIIGSVNALERMWGIVQQIYGYISPIVDSISSSLNDLNDAFPGVADVGRGMFNSMIAETPGAMTASEVGPSAIIQQAREGQERQRSLSSIRSSTASDIGAEIERSVGDEISNYISNFFSEEGGSSVVNSIAESIENITSSTSTAPVTQRTVSSRPTTTQNQQVISIAPTEVNLDSRSIGQIFWQSSARA